jgi:hypothetical protein
MTVRIFFTVLAVLVWATAIGVAGETAPVHPEQPTVVIVTSSTVEAFEEAVAGIRRGLGTGVTVVVLDLTAKPETPNPLAAKEARLFITVGNNALEHAAQAARSPLIATMILRTDLATQRLKPPTGAVVLDLPFAEMLLKVAKVFPGKTRVGIVRNPESWSASATSLAAQAKTAGMTLTVIDCARPRAPDAVLSLPAESRGLCLGAAGWRFVQQLDGKAADSSLVRKPDARRRIFGQLCTDGRRRRCLSGLFRSGIAGRRNGPQLPERREPGERKSP